MGKQLIDGMTQDEAREKIYGIAERNGYLSRTDAWIETSGGKNWPEMNEADSEWISQTLLPRHGSYEHKRGAGFASFIFGINSRYPSKRTQRPPACLYASRVDGTITDISWRECLKPASKRFKVRNAMRNAIRPQIAKWKAECVKACQLCSARLDPRDFDADHYPISFDMIASQWMNDRGLTDETILTSGSDDFYRGDRFIDIDLEFDWFQYHASVAAYRQVCSPCHRRLPR